MIANAVALEEQCIIQDDYAHTRIHVVEFASRVVFLVVFLRVSMYGLQRGPNATDQCISISFNNNPALMATLSHLFVKQAYALLLPR